MTPWHTKEEKPDMFKSIIAQTNYGFMVGYRDYNGLFTPMTPLGSNVIRALRNRGNVRLIRWRYRF